MDEKKVLGFSLFGIIRSEEPWRKAHKDGMKELAKRGGMPELLEKVNEPNYFEFVKEALSKIDEYKNFSERERISKRRKQYFDRVLGLIKDYIDKDFVSFLKELKNDYELILITTNLRDFVDEVLRLADASEIFNYIFTSMPNEEDNKKIVFDKAIKEGKKPDIFVGSEKSGEICKELGIDFIKYRNLEKLKEELE
jgi:hypothetical protein